MVSLEPIITLAHLDIYESGPYVAYISPRRVKLALPDKGLMSMSSVSSPGIPIISKTGDKTFEKSFAIPETRNSVIAKNMATRKGKIRRHIPSASFAPSVNVS